MDGAHDTTSKAALEQLFRRLSSLLYDTRVDADVVDAEVAGYLDDDVRFTDPWQTGSGKARYRLGAAGFHCMFDFHLDIAQVGVHLSDDGTRGRAFVDGVMQLKALGLARALPSFVRLPIYPLRTQLVYEFVIDGAATDRARVRIVSHEEMWSIADMLVAVPVLGPAYARWFRPTFARGFLLACRLCTGRAASSFAAAPPSDR